MAILHNPFYNKMYNLHILHFVVDTIILLRKGLDKMMYQHIRDLREDADLTQGQIAGMIPCSQQAYSLYERGARDIPTQVLIRLAEIHRTTTAYLLGLTDYREIPACMERERAK